MARWCSSNSRVIVRGGIMGEPSAYELGKMVGKYEAVTEATKKHLQSIDKKLEAGDTCMQEMKKDLSSALASKEKMDIHIDNPDIHFNKQKFKQGKLGYIAKKKALAIVITTLATLLSALVAWGISTFNNTSP